MPTIDAHLDTLFILSGIALQKEANVTAERMKQGRLDKGIFALYIQDAKLDRMSQEAVGSELTCQIKLAKMHFHGHYIAMEGARVLGPDNPLIRLRWLAEQGIRYLTLTHNSTNWLCGSSTAHFDDVGLSKMGRAVISECEKLGVFVDVSHASDRSVNDILAYSTSRPTIASHSGCRSILSHPRNLTDEHIVQIALTGGVVGVPFALRFVGGMAGVVYHIDHICQLTQSCRHACVGSDIDGAALAHGIRGVEDWGAVVMDQLAKMNYSDEQIGLIAGGNLQRLLDGKF